MFMGFMIMKHPPKIASLIITLRVAYPQNFYSKIREIYKPRNLVLRKFRLYDVAE